MRVLHAINQVSGRAGAEVSLRDILLGTAHEVEHAVVVLGAENNVLEPFEQATIPCFVPGPDARNGRIAAVRHVRSAIRAFQPHLVHTTLFDADLAGRVAAKLERVPVISSVVNTPYGPEATAAEPVSRWKLRAARAVDGFLARRFTSGFHAISAATARHAEVHLRVAPQVMRIVPRGRSRQALGERSSQRRADVRERLGWNDHPVVINVAREEPQKGQRTLLEAFPGVLAEHPDALLVIVGRRGRSSAVLDRLVDELRLGGSVERLGVRTDVADLVSAADVFAFPSHYEGLGGAAVEALGLGMPIVASDIPALRELLAAERGWLVPPGDQVALAASILEVLRGGEEVERRSQAAREYFDRSYELDRCLEGMLDLYRDIESQLSVDPKASRWRRFVLRDDPASGGAAEAEAT